MTLLTVIQNACGLLSLRQPTGVVTSTDLQVQQLYALANEEGADLASSIDWQALTSEWTFTTVAAGPQVSAIPPDWDHFLANSFFNRTSMRPIIGPITPQQWQALQAYPAYGRVYLAFRERAGQFLITPNPPAGQIIAYEYVSKNWARGSNGIAKAAYNADDDLTYVSEALITLGIRWRFLKSKGLDYTQDEDTYNRQKAQVMARDGGSTKLNITGADSYQPLPNLPEGNFPGT